MLIEKLAPYNRCESAVLEQWVPFEHGLEATINTEHAWADEGLIYLKTLLYFK